MHTPNTHDILLEQMESNLTFISTLVATAFSVTSMEVMTCTMEEGVMGAATVGMTTAHGVTTTVGAVMTMASAKVTTCRATVFASKVTTEFGS